jgi:hypothetical protein
MTDKKVVKKTRPAASCESANHVFIVTDWKVAGGRQTALHMRCRCCLMPMDLQEIESAEWRIKEGI